MIDPRSLILVSALGTGVFWVAGKTGMLPRELGQIWGDIFNKGKPPPGTPRPPGTPGGGQRPPGTPGGVSPGSGAGQNGSLPPDPGSGVPAPGGGRDTGTVTLPPVDVSNNQKEIRISGDRWVAVTGEGDAWLFCDFAADRYEYVPGETITLHGALYVRGADNNDRSPGFGITHKIHIVDPNVNEPRGTTFLSARVWAGGIEWSVQYTATETAPWQAYAYWDGTMGSPGYRSGILTFVPVERIDTNPPPADPPAYDPDSPNYGLPTWPDPMLGTLQADWQDMNNAWAEYSYFIEGIMPDLNASFLAHWQALQDQIGYLESGQAGPHDSSMLHEWAQWYVAEAHRLYFEGV